MGFSELNHQLGSLSFVLFAVFCVVLMSPYVYSTFRLKHIKYRYLLGLANCVVFCTFSKLRMFFTL